jgi:DNA-binding MarR family transcriptional regulator
MQEDPSPALLRLFDETTALFHRLRTIASQVHGQSELSAGRRGVLRSLDLLGPQTVPQLARARPVSRQHIQMLVNDLLKDELVTTEENPAHRRSPLLRLTSEGKRHLEAMRKRENLVLAHVHPDLSPKQLANAADALQSVRRFLESKEWRKQIAKHH